jgi:Protein of unknown function (DUF664)
MTLRTTGILVGCKPRRTGAAVDRALEPGNVGERELLLAWLAFHRDALAYKCDGLSAEQMVSASALPSDLSLLGLVRHMTEMERVYLVHALAGGEFRFEYCNDPTPDADIVGLEPAMTAESMDLWHRERAHADQLLSNAGSLDSVVAGNKYTVRWNLIKVIQEYARHNGHADIIRQRIDGATGE